MVRLVLAIGLGALAACRGGQAPVGKVTMFERVWTIEGAAPFQDGALRWATLGPASSLVDGQVVATATGAVRWPAPSATRLIGLAGEAAIGVRIDGDRGVAIERRGLADGAALGEAIIADAAGAASPLRMVNAGLELAPGRLLYAALGRVRAFAVDGGAEAWTVAVPGTAIRTVSSGGQVGVVDGMPARRLVVVDAATGAEQWQVAIDGADTDVMAAPRGGFLVPRGDQVVELAADGREVRAVRGRLSAAAGDLVVAKAGDDLVVYDGGGAVLDRIQPRGAGDYVAAAGLCDRAVVYFRSHDTTVWWRPVGGVERPITTVAARTAVVEGERHSAGATLTEPPRCVAGLVLVSDWVITAYRVPSP